MTEIKHILFDFDGTLVDTIDMALTFYNKIAPDYHCKPVDQEDIKNLSTHKLQELLPAYGITKFKIFILLLRIRKEVKKQIAEIKPIKNMESTLLDLKNRGYKLGVVTSNSRNTVSKFLANNQLSGVFDFICSSNHFFGKDRVLRRLIRRYKITKGNAIYVGDETRDVEASKRAGMAVIAVCWGLSSRKMLETTCPDQIADSPKDIYTSIQQIFRE